MQPPSVSEAVRGTDPSHKLPLLRREAVQHDIFFNKLPPLRGGSFKCLFSMHTAPCEGRGSVKSPSFPIDCLVRERRQCETHFFSTDCLARERRQFEIHILSTNCLVRGRRQCETHFFSTDCLVRERKQCETHFFSTDCLVREKGQCETHFFSTDCLARERRQCKIHILRTNCLTGKKNSGKGDWIGRCGRAAKYFPEFGEILESENAFCYNQNEQTFEGLA